MPALPFSLDRFSACWRRCSFDIFIGRTISHSSLHFARLSEQSSLKKKGPHFSRYRHNFSLPQFRTCSVGSADCDITKRPCAKSPQHCNSEVTKLNGLKRGLITNNNRLLITTTTISAIIAPSEKKYGLSCSIFSCSAQWNLLSFSSKVTVAESSSILLPAAQLIHAQARVDSNATSQWRLIGHGWWTLFNEGPFMYCPLDNGSAF